MEELLKILLKQKIIKASEALEVVGNRMALLRMVERGDIQKLGGGYYASNSVSSMVAGLMVVAKYYPYAVISGETALRVHGLGDAHIRAVDVDIKREQSIRNELLSTHRVARKYITGVEQIEYEGARIKVYSKERCLYEAYKISGFGHEFYKALKRYVQSQKESIPFSKFSKYDKLFNVDVWHCIAQELADD